MKTIINKIAIILLSAVSLVVFSCKEEIVRDPSPITNDKSTNVYFAANNVSNPTLPKDAKSYEISIEREKVDQSQTVALTTESVYDDLFEVPTTVTFAQGEKTKKISILVKDIELMKRYHFTIIIDPEQSKPYSNQNVYSRLELNILKEDFAPYAEGEYTSTFFEITKNTVLQYSPSTKVYRFKDCWAKGYDYKFSVAEDGKITQIPAKTATGVVNENYGMISATADPKQSKFDSATNTYKFVIKWTVSAGSFGVENDKFVVTKKL